eukprot:645402-Pyramimonas_sp.AAC.1
MASVQRGLAGCPTILDRRQHASVAYNTWSMCENRAIEMMWSRRLIPTFRRVVFMMSGWSKQEFATTKSCELHVSMSN